MVQKRPGRPRRFDPEAAALAAAEVFWEKGYDGASLDDLTEALGINRPSLYNAFGDKRGLFLAALEAYGQTFGVRPLAAFEAEADLRAAVRVFFETALEAATRENGKARGCLFGTAAVASVPAIDGTAEVILAMNQRIRGRLAERFAAAMQSGHLPASPSAETRAALMVELMQGQAHRARIGEDATEIGSDLEARVSAILP